MSRIAQLSANAILDQYAQGAAAQAISPVAEFISPTVPVARAKGKFKQWNDKTRLVVPDTRRALGGDGTTIGFEFTDADYSCEPHALNYGADFAEEDENDVVENLVKEGSDIAASLGAMAHEKNVLTLMNSGATAGTTIDTTSSSFEIINTINGHLLDVIKGAKGWGTGMILRVVVGAAALQKISGHADIKARYKSGRQPNGFISPTLNDIASMLMLPAEAKASLMVQDANANLDAASVDFMLGSKLLIFATIPKPSRYDTSFMKTFRKMGAFMKPRYWSAPSGRQDYAGWDWSEQVQVTNAAASRLCTVS